MNHDAVEPRKGAHNGTGLYRQIANPCSNALLEHVIQRRINQTGHDYGFRYNRQIYKYDSYILSIKTHSRSNRNPKNFLRNIAGDLAISEAEINFEKYFFVTSFHDCHNNDVTSTKHDDVLDQLISGIFIRSRDNPLSPYCITDGSLEFEFVNMENGLIKSLGGFFH